MNSLLDKYVFLLPCQKKHILSFCQDFLDELNYFCDTWVTLTESMWTEWCQWNWRVVNSFEEALWNWALGSAMVMAALPVQETHFSSSYGCNLHTAPGWWWLHEGHGVGLLFCWSVTWPRLWSENFPTVFPQLQLWLAHQGKPFCRTANVLVSWLSCRPVRRKDPSLVRL